MHSFVRSRKAVFSSSLAAVAVLGLLAACTSDAEPAGPSSSSGGGSAVEDSGPRASSSGAEAGPATDAALPADSGAQPEAGPVLSTVHFVGRFDLRDAEGPRFEWAGTGLIARFQGTGISIRLRGVASSHQFTVVIDGTTITRLVLTAPEATYMLAEGLPVGEHVVEVHRRTEALFGPTQFLGFTVAGGQLVPSAAPAARHVEVIGDSITNGYGNEGASAACGFSAETENEYVAFGARTARALGATHTAIAWSGRGLRVNYNDDAYPTVPTLFERTLATEETQPWDFSRITPDVVVVYLGTNDTWSAPDPGVEFTTAYVAFLGRIRSVYPAAQIFVAAAPERQGVVTRAGAAVEARNANGDAAVHFFQFDPYDSALGIGCDYHPSAASHAVMAEKLSAAIRAIMGW